MKRLIGLSNLYNFIAGAILSMATAILIEVAKDSQWIKLVTFTLMILSCIFLILLSEITQKTISKFDELKSSPQIKDPLNRAIKEICKEKRISITQYNIILFAYFISSILLFIASLITLFTL